MTIQRAIEVLDEFEIVETSRGIFNISFDGETDIISEQTLIEAVRKAEAVRDERTFVREEHANVLIENDNFLFILVYLSLAIPLT